MGKIAIDVVLLPPMEISEKCVSMSCKLFEGTKNGIVVLDSKTCLPHISLAMGCVDEKDLGVVSEKIRDVSSRFLPLDLKLEGINVHSDITDLAVEKIEGIQKLHEEIMNVVEPYLKEGSLEALYQNPLPSEKTINWVMNYKNNSSFENFHPHITIGYGELKDVDFPINFTADEIAICHLGRYCTCRNVLWSNKSSYRSGDATPSIKE